MLLGQQLKNQKQIQSKDLFWSSTFFFVLFYFYIYPFDLQESDGGANT